jgi:phosphoribosylaminoimidazole-succinocarboxamide synthase
MVLVECVARGYLTGSAFKEYSKTGRYQEFALPEGLHDGDALTPPLFTPAMKAEIGDHDENVTYAQVAEAVGDGTAEELRELTLKIFETAQKVAARAGMTLVDTKFEFGFDPLTGLLTLGDEVLTPDSSRYWNAAGESYDKQYVRNWLLNDSGWSPDSGEKPPALPTAVVERTAEIYRTALKQLTAA